MSPASSSTAALTVSTAPESSHPPSIQSVRSEIVQRVRRLVREESGQTLVEYALILAVVALALVAALTGVSDALTRAFGAITSALNGLVS
jgi:pilus assembly protein Flp/PilA